MEQPRGGHCRPRALRPRWAELFAEERRAIRQEVDASIALVVEHFGSTAIPGMTAKPIIDILIGAERWTWPDIVAALERLEYVHWADNGRAS